MEILKVTGLRPTLIIVICIALTRVRFTYSSTNFINILDRRSWLGNESDLKLGEEVLLFTESDINLERRENRKILVRKSREAVPSGDLDKNIDKLITDATGIIENIKKEPASRATFVRPSSHGKAAMFDNELKKIKKEIEDIKSSLSSSDSLRVKVNSFEEVITKVQRDFDEKNREFAGGLENVENFMSLLTGAVVNINRELYEIKRQIVQSERSNSENAMAAEVIAEIKSRNFASAYEKMQKLKDPNKINFIVHEIYNNNDGNFDLIVQFGDSIKFVESSFRVYKALNYQMESSNHDNPLKLVKLIDSLESQVINQLEQSNPVKEEATAIAEKIKSLLKNILVGKIKEASKSGKYESVSSLCDRVFLTQGRLFNEAVKQATKENLDAVNPGNLVSYYAAHKYVGQSIYGYAAVFNELKSRGRSDDKAMISLALKLKQLMQQSNYGQVASEERSVAASTKASMATSLRNLAFASRVCLKNNELAEYLYAAGDDYKADDGRRTVLTWIKGTQVIQGDWIIEPDGDVFYIKNYSHNEYLYAAGDGYAYDQSRRNVYTWIPGGRVTQGRWVFELTGPNVYIKNYEHGGYLFADQSLKRDSGRRRVFNWFYSSKPDNGIWKIVDCS